MSIHQAPITQDGWSGAGFTVIDQATGAGGYLIEGGTGGGFFAVLIVTGVSIFLTLALYKVSIILLLAMLLLEIRSFLVWVDSIAAADTQEQFDLANAQQGTIALLSLVPALGFRELDMFIKGLAALFVLGDVIDILFGKKKQ